MPKQVRWECPHGLHPGKLGSTRPRKNATVRFCLPCSEAEGYLVERVAPALQRKREMKSAATAERMKSRAEKAREEKANRHKVDVLSSKGDWSVTLDVGVLLKEAWKTKTLRDEQEDAFFSGENKVPELVIRRGAPDNGRPANREQDSGRYEKCLPIRARDGLSGHASGGDRIVMTIRPNCGEEWVRAVIIHEAAHAACPASVVHGARWKRAYVKAVKEIYPAIILPPMMELDKLVAWQLDEYIAQAIYEMNRNES